MFDFDDFIKRKSKENASSQDEDVDFSFLQNDTVLLQSAFVLCTALMNVLLQKNLITQAELKEMILNTIEAMSEDEDEDQR